MRRPQVHRRFWCHLCLLPGLPEFVAHHNGCWCGDHDRGFLWFCGPGISAYCNFMFFLTHHFYKKGSAYVCALVCAYMHMCACVCVHICVHACIYVCVCVFIILNKYILDWCYCYFYICTMQRLSQKRKCWKLSCKVQHMRQTNLSMCFVGIVFLNTLGSQNIWFLNSFNTDWSCSLLKPLLFAVLKEMGYCHLQLLI